MLDNLIVYFERGRRGFAGGGGGRGGTRVEGTILF